MSPPDLNSLPPSTTSNSTQTPPSTSQTQQLGAINFITTILNMRSPAPTIPPQPPRATTTNSSTQADSGNPRTMSMASQQENERGFRENSGIGSPSSSLRGHSESPRLSFTSSLQAAAALNAGLRSEEDSRRSSVGSITRQRSTRSPHTTARRRSTVLMTLQLNDPTLPSPGEMVSSSSNDTYPLLTSYPFRGSPRSRGSPILPSRETQHTRAPSLGEIHQELEQEQEAQVNRLLQMIRVQQAQLQALQAAHPPAGHSASSSAVEDGNVPGDLNTHMDMGTILSVPAGTNISPSAVNATLPPGGGGATQPVTIPTTGATPIRTTTHPRSSLDLSRSVRTGSRTPSRNASPGLKPSLQGRSPSIGPVFGRQQQQSGEWVGGGGVGVGTRDEAQFYQAEAQMMGRENQMLRVRIRELEREVGGRIDGEGMGRRGSVGYEPSTLSCLTTGVSGGGGGEPRGDSGNERGGGEGTGRGGSRQDRVGEMGRMRDEENASPRTTPALWGKEKEVVEADALASGDKE